jgi:hypothetical protein
MALMSYLLNDRHGTYYFRRVIPPAPEALHAGPVEGQGKLEADAQNEATI